MTISEMVAELERLKAEHGDVDVLARDAHCCGQGISPTARRDAPARSTGATRRMTWTGG